MITVFRRVRVNLGDLRLLDNEKAIPVGREVRPLKGDLFSVKGGVTEGLHVTARGLTAYVVPESQASRFIMSGGKAPVERVHCVLNDAELNRNGSQVYTQRRLGPIEITTTYRGERIRH